MQILNDIMLQIPAMMAVLPTWMWLTVLAGLLITWNGLRSRRRLHRMQAELERVRNDMRAMTTAAVGVGGRVREIEMKQRQLKTQLPAQKTATEKPVQKKPETIVAFRSAVEDYAAHPYDHAIQLARHGATVNEIMFQSGIGQHEAKLIHMLHAVSKAG